jgi:hypothetical protein
LAHQARALPPVPTAMTPKQFRAIAVEIWGDSWSAGAATALGVPIATVTGWMTAGRPIPPPIPSAMLAFQRAYEQMVTARAAALAMAGPSSPPCPVPG